MQEDFYDMAFERSTSPAASSSPHQMTDHSSTAPASAADLTRLFNAAILSTRADRKKDFAGELYNLVESPAFEAILGAIRTLSRTGGFTERQAAEQIVQTFRRIDSVWTEYVIQEGVDRLRS
jgi:hypothetical protein